MISPTRRWRHPLALYAQLIFIVSAWLFAVYMVGMHGTLEYVAGVVLLLAAWLLGGRAGLRAARAEATSEKISNYNQGLREAYDAAARLLASLHEQHHRAVAKAGTVTELGGWTAKQLSNTHAHLQKLAGR